MDNPIFPEIRITEEPFGENGENVKLLTFFSYVRLEEGGKYYLAPLKVSIERDSSDALTYEKAKTESLQMFFKMCYRYSLLGVPGGKDIVSDEDQRSEKECFRNFPMKIFMSTRKLA